MGSEAAHAATTVAGKTHFRVPATLLELPLPGKARSSMNITDMTKQVPTATVWLRGMEQDVTLHLQSLEMPLCSSLSSPFLRALDQSSLSHLPHTGREKGCVLWPEEGGKLPHPAGLLGRHGHVLPELFLPCPRCDPRAGPGQRGFPRPGLCPTAGQAAGGWGGVGGLPHCRGGGQWPMTTACSGAFGKIESQGASAESGQSFLPGRDHIWL